MTFGTTATMACLGAVITGMAVTHPLELRNHRWLKIGLTLPIVVLVVSIFYELAPVRGYFGLCGIALLAFIWRSPVAHFGSLMFLRVLNGDMNRPTGIRAEFGAAKALRKHGDLAEAISYTRGELEKDPLSYEGLLLLADLYDEAGEPGRAVKQLEKLFDRAPLTEEQKDLVATRLEALKAAGRKAAK